MNRIALESQLGIINPVRSKRWEYMTKEADGKTRRSDIKNNFEQYTVEQLLENTIQGAKESFHMLGTTNEQVMKMVYESTTNASPGVATFLKFAFPLIRQIWAKSIGKNLVSVQPMKTPDTRIFTIDYLRNSPQAGTSITDRSVSGAKDYALDPGELSTPVRELNITVTGETVSASSKKIKSKYSIEVEQDLMSYHNISISSELLGIMALEISLEIDQQIIYDLVTGAGAGDVEWNSNPGTTTPTEVEAYKKTIKDAFVSANNLIFANMYRDANFIVAGIAEIERLEQLGDWAYTPAKDQGISAFGRVNVGTLFGKYQVYKDPFFPVDNTYLVGFKGENWLESGYVFAPYMPYMSVPAFTNPDDFSVTRAGMSRQGYKMKNSGAYATVTIVGS